MPERGVIRKLTVTGKGNSYYLTFPREIVKRLGWRKGEKKIVYQEGTRVVIEDWRANKGGA